MGYAEPVSSKGILSVLDFSAQDVRVVHARLNKQENFDVLGVGRSQSRGRGRADFTHLGDAAEAVLEAVCLAENASGAKTGFLYYNVTDADARTEVIRGSRTLAGEGQIKRTDVLEVRDAAERSVNRFDRRILYSHVRQYVIDHRDAVEDPVGVFGQNLEAEIFILTARAGFCDQWNRVLSRAGMNSEGCFSFSTAHAVAEGVWGEGNRNSQFLVWQVEKDLAQGVVISGGALNGLTVLPVSDETGGWQLLGEKMAEETGRLAQIHGTFSEILLTGEAALDGFASGGGLSALPVPSGPAVVAGAKGFETPRDAALCGLLRLAARGEKRRSAQKADRPLLSRMKEKAVGFFAEYF